MRLYFRGRGAIARNAGVAFAILAGSYLFAGFVLVPWLAPGLLSNAIEDALRARASIEAVELDPFTFRVELRGVVLDTEDGEPLLRLARAEANFEPLDSLVLGALALWNVHVEGADVSVVIDPAGELNWLRTLPLPEPDEEETSDAPAFALVLHEFLLRESTAELSDLSRSVPLNVRLAPIDVEIRSLEFGTERVAEHAPLDLNIGLASGGHIHLLGNVDLAPPRATLDIDAKSLYIPNVSALVEGVSRASVSSGLLDVDGRLVFDSEAPSPVDFTGGIVLRELAVQDDERQEEILSAAEIALVGIDASSQPLQIEIDRIRLAEPRIALAVERGGELNLARVAKPRVAAAASVTPSVEGDDRPAPDGPSALIRIGEVALSGGSAAIEDRSLDPAIRLVLSDLALRLRDIGTDGGTPIQVDLEGRAGARSRIELVGRVAPFASPPSGDLTLTVRDLELQTFSSYSARYAGHPIENGHVNVDLAYQLQGVTLRGRNEILVDGLDLGRRVDSPQAPNVPVALGVELLKDKDGRISLDVPVQGEVDDPEFSVLGVIGRTLVTQLVKVTSQPFRMLGALVPGGSLPDVIVFEPGSSRLGAVEGGQVRALADVLGERDRLVLALSPSASRDDDGVAIARQRMEEALLAVHGDRFWRRKSSDDTRVLAQDQRQKAMRRLHDRLERDGRIAEPPAVSAGGDEVAENGLAEAAEDERLEAAVIATMPVSDDDLLELAAARGREVRLILEASGGIDPARVRTAPPVVIETGARDGAGVRLSLDAR